MAEKPEASDIYETIRNAGFGLETQLNEWIQDQLNEEKLVLPAAFLSNAHGKLIQFISEFQEIISLHLNTPTKDDVANVAKMLVQTEEKVDDLSDRMDDLASAVDKLRTGTYKRPSSSHSSSARNVTKLLSHNEEKGNDLSDRMDDLASAVEELRTGMDKRPSSSHSPSARSVEKLLRKTEEKVDDLSGRIDDLASAVEELRTGMDKRPASSHSSSARHAKGKRKSGAQDNKKKASLEELLSSALNPKSFILLNSDSALGDESFLKLLHDVKLKRRMKR